MKLGIILETRNMKKHGTPFASQPLPETEDMK